MEREEDGVILTEGLGLAKVRWLSFAPLQAFSCGSSRSRWFITGLPVSEYSSAVFSFL
jgi:hypothetical protein